MASPSSLIPAEERSNNPSPPPRSGGRGAEPPGPNVLLVGGPDPAAADYVRCASRGGCSVRSLVLFLSPGLTESCRADLDALVRQAGERRVEFVGVVSTFRVHLGDRAAAEAEEDALGRLRSLSARCVVFRPGHILSPASPARPCLLRVGFCYSLLPGSPRGCSCHAD